MKNEKNENLMKILDKGLRRRKKYGKIGVVRHVYL
jgi:hypothetical protein